MKIDIYYGLMGVLKGTTIENLVKKNPRLKILKTANKSWKYYENSIYKGLIQYNDLNLAIQHLVRLGEFIQRNSGSDIIVERGITDYLFYYWHEPKSLCCGMPEEKTVIENSIEAEDNLVKDYTKQKILLVMKDTNFVKSKVLTNQYRQNFSSLDQYFKKQEEYVNFTKKYNKIDKTIEIVDAKNYIENILGEKYIN